MFYHADKFSRQRSVLNYYIAEQRLISRWRETSLRIQGIHYVKT